MKIKLMLALLICLGSSTIFAAGKIVHYKIDGQPYEGHFNFAGKNAPLVLLLHDWDGLTDYEIKRSNMLVALGYSVFSADLFGAGIRPTKVSDKRQHTGALYKNRKKMRKLLKGALKAAKAQGGDVSNAVSMGYCFGGAAALELARSGAELKGFATFHGGLTTPSNQNYQETKGKILIMHGSADKHISMDDFSNLTNELEKDNIPHEMITYSGAPHAFTVFGAPSYREEADRASWDRFVQFLRARLKP